MISAWARICKILGPAFAPYLPVVMGPIMKTASMKPEVALLDNEELTGVENDSEDWQFVSLGEQQNFGIKTAGNQMQDHRYAIKAIFILPIILVISLTVS